MEVHTSFSKVHTSTNLNLIFLRLITSCRGAFMPHSPLPFTSGTLHPQLLSTSENKMLTQKCGKRKEEMGNKQPQRHQVSKKEQLLVRNLLPMNVFTYTFTLETTVTDAPQTWTGSCGKKVLKSGRGYRLSQRSMVGK